jgi:UDP-N-acetyl-D-mannosaminuronic acid transferase (WecB/TagA/CpsF family)
MKPNEWVLTIVQLAAPIFCFSLGMKAQGIFLSVWLVFFGISEAIAKGTTGKTLSQHVWTKPKWVRHTLGAIMTAGMIALWVHFAIG